MVTHPNREDTRRLRFSFFLNDVKQREGFDNPSIRTTDAQPLPDPLRETPATFSQYIGYSREFGGAGRHRVPQWCGLYERRPASVKHFVAKFSFSLVSASFQWVIRDHRPVDNFRETIPRAVILERTDKVSQGARKLATGLRRDGGGQHPPGRSPAPSAPLEIGRFRRRIAAFMVNNPETFRSDTEQIAVQVLPRWRRLIALRHFRLRPWRLPVIRIDLPVSTRHPLRRPGHATDDPRRLRTQDASRQCAATGGEAGAERKSPESGGWKGIGGIESTRRTHGEPFP